MMIYPKHDYLLNRDLTNSERLEPQRKTVEIIRRHLDELDHVLNNASDKLTEADLMVVADAVENAYNAVANAALLGTSDFHPLPVRVVRWGEQYREKQKAPICMYSVDGKCAISPDATECGGTVYEAAECAYKQ